MTLCMASRVCTSRFNPLCLTSTTPHALIDKQDSFRHVLSGSRQGRSYFQSKACAAPHSDKFGLVIARADGSRSEESSSSTTTTVVDERTEVDLLVDGMTFGQLCDEFECISSPAVERTARQLAKDILQLKEDKRAIGTFAIFVLYKDPLRSFKGREKFNRPSYIRATLDNPSVAVQEMTMLSTSILNIRWTLRGKPKLPPASLVGGDLVLSVNSLFTLNQISGQVIQQVDEWNVSGSSPLAEVYFWTTRLAYSVVEAGKDAGEAVIGVSKLLDKGKDDDRSTYFPDPSGDPRKFFQVEDNPQRDFYQLGFVIALLYLVVQFLKLTL